MERRRSARVFVAIPVEVTWKTETGGRVTERGETAMVGAHGALLQMKAVPPVRAEVELRVVGTGQTAAARVLGSRLSGGNGSSLLTVELLAPSQTFWGVALPLPPVKGFRVTAKPEVARSLTRVLEKLQAHNLAVGLTLQATFLRPIPADLWKELEELLKSAGLDYEPTL